jgi:methionyl-tRNA formyltransferase
MNLAFAGTPEFARTSLEALLAAGHEVACVFTQPDRPAGRGLKLQSSPVKACAEAHGLPIWQPRSLRLDGKYPEDPQAARAALAAAINERGVQALIVAAYGLILPPRGCINVHGSLLPRWRGAAPIHRAIEAGDSHTGITIMQMDAGLDTGPMLLAQAEPIHPHDSTATLHDRLAALGGRLLVQALAGLETGQVLPTPQPEAGVTYAHKVDKAEAELNPQRPAAELERRVRAFDPFPGCTLSWGAQAVKVWRAAPAAAPLGLRAGQLFCPGGDSTRLAWVCGEHAHEALELLELQAPRGSSCNAARCRLKPCHPEFCRFSA